MQKYYKRFADEILKFKLDCCGAVIVKGPKWCGKSTTSERVAKSIVYMQDTETSDDNVVLAKTAPKLFLDGPTPRLIDEWQVVPEIWDQIRFQVDQRNKTGQFILTGSATPIDLDDKRQHSGIGRIVPLVMRPMTLLESKDSKGGISVSSLFKHVKIEPVRTDITFEKYAYLTCRGGWPTVLDKGEKAALEQAKIFYSGLVEEDIRFVVERMRNPERIKRLMRSLARATASEMGLTQIKEDVIANDDDSLDVATIASLINALERLFVVENMPSWNPNLRSKAAIRKSVTRHFVDPSIGAAALGISPQDLLGDIKTFGLFFESLVVRDLRVIAESLEGEVRHYRDSNGLEADAVMHLPNGNWAAFEVKLAGEYNINEGAKSLLKLASIVKGKKPEFLAVITATGLAYRRDDGVFVIPLGALEV